MLWRMLHSLTNPYNLEVETFLQNEPPGKANTDIFQRSGKVRLCMCLYNQSEPSAPGAGPQPVPKVPDHGSLSVSSKGETFLS